MRIDKYLANLWYGSRKDVIKLIKDWFIEVNENPIFEVDYKINFWDFLKIQYKAIQAIIG